jgi:ABC-type transport system involved in cytochrome c biogenesis ATPase subunit
MTSPAINLNDPPLLDVRRVNVTFGRQPVLREIELTVPRGQTLAIIGESGCGKTVLLKTLIGLIRPTRGEVLFDGQNLLKLEDKQLVQQRIRFGFLFQNAALFDSMTVGQNVAFPLRQHRRTTDHEVQELVLARLAEVGLPDSVVVKKPAELSAILIKSGRLKWAWVTGVPLAWDAAVTLTASWQKIFSADPRIGFFAQRARFAEAIEQGKVLAPAKNMADMHAVVVNSTVDGVLAGLFAVLVVLVIGNAALVCVRAVRSREPLPMTEAPYVESRLVVPSGLLTTDRHELVSDRS